MSDEIIGADELIRKLKGLGDGLADALEAAVTTGALIVQNAAKEKAPYRTGTLRRSIHTETDKVTNVRADVLVGTNVVYAHNQEFGTTVPAHPFLRPAADENKREVANEIKDALADIVRGSI